MKGIVLAGGSGTRLYPVTRGLSKQLLPVYDKPMIYFPLSTLMLAKIRDILIISTPQDIAGFKRLLGDGTQWGLNLSYAVQETPAGIAQALLIGSKFIDGERVALILGDNAFHGAGLASLLQRADARQEATCFAYHVPDPSRYGVVTFDKNGRAISIVEKPTEPTSSWAVTGLYFYDADVVSIAASLKPSARGELEITDLNQIYLERKKLKVERLGRGFAWLDMGTHDSLLDAANFVQAVQRRQGLQIASVDEIAFRMGFIDAHSLYLLAEELGRTEYAAYLQHIAREEDTEGFSLNQGIATPLPEIGLR